MPRDGALRRREVDAHALDVALRGGPLGLERRAGVVREGARLADAGLEDRAATSFSLRARSNAAIERRA